MIKHWRTSLLGLAAIGVGLWSMHATYVATNTIYFNVVYVWPGQLALLLVGAGLLYAADHKNIKP